jgi:hypothetical protein
MAKRRRAPASCSMTNVDRILDSVTPQREVTIDAAECTPAQVDRIYATAKARGFHASGTRRWILVRPPPRSMRGYAPKARKR